ncbi:uncharacterized protein ACHE_50306A [Aspergillus chevalieri]|uniref:Uncharacterized protein n=1 Tax=Aspergillus chevalieri TaxID=182096 RepID=A0A7R7VS13_ASPCH|nr:uncharacterized protein ACHE_50306A [Aspergillus chevalieri]BCR89108.1 hypothetical protein ACHE_50306A [Aspergillus chevalieri]
MIILFNWRIPFASRYEFPQPEEDEVKSVAAGPARAQQQVIVLLGGEAHDSFVTLEDSGLKAQNRVGPPAACDLKQETCAVVNWFGCAAECSAAQICGSQGGQL